MKISFKSLAVISALALPILLTGCLEREFAEENAVLSADIEELIVPADLREGADLVTDTVFVTSNRSWSADFTTPVDWVKVEICESLNLSHVSSVTPIVLSFKDNKTDEDRTAVLHVTCADSDRDILVRQKAIKYRLELTDQTDERIVAEEANYVGNVKCEPDTARLFFNTNCDWTAKLLDGCSDGIRIGESEGSGSGHLYVYFDENEDEAATKEGTVLISAPGCDDIKVKFTQARGVPYVKFLDEPHELSTLNVPSVGARLTVKVKSNVAWTLKVKDGETLDAKFVVAQKDANGNPIKDEGGRTQYNVYDEYAAEKGETSAVVAFLGNTDFDNDGTITLQLTAPGAEPAEKTFTVDKLSKVFLSFRMWPDIYTGSSSSTYYHPFMEDLYASSKCLKNSDVYKCCNGYEFLLYSAGTVLGTARMCVNSANGLNVGTGYNMVRIGLPGVPGKKLAKVTIMNGSTSTSTTWLRYGITSREFGNKIVSGEVNDIAGDAAGSAAKVQTVPGGDLIHLKPIVRSNVTYNSPDEDKASNPTSFTTFELLNSEVGAGYDIVCLYGTSLRWIELIYE